MYTVHLINTETGRHTGIVLDKVYHRVEFSPSIRRKVILHSSAIPYRVNRATSAVMVVLFLDVLLEESCGVRNQRSRGHLNVFDFLIQTWT